jgi:hypothetical protein
LAIQLGVKQNYVVRAGRFGIRLVLCIFGLYLVEQLFWNIPAILGDLSEHNII